MLLTVTLILLIAALICAIGELAGKVTHGVAALLLVIIILLEKLPR